MWESNGRPGRKLVLGIGIVTNQDVIAIKYIICQTVDLFNRVILDYVRIVVVMI